ncbi:MAG: serine/threonine protein kinase, partial [Planctomycetia bacterium]
AAEVLDLMSGVYELQHLDIKPSNLFLSGGHVKVADFSLVRVQNSAISRHGVVLTPQFAPPELFGGKIESSADQYSLAVTYQALLTGEFPYPGPDVRQLLFQQLRDEPQMQRLPTGDRAIVRRALSQNPADRYDCCLEFTDRLAAVIDNQLPTADFLDGPNASIDLETGKPVLLDGPSEGLFSGDTPQNGISDSSPAKKHHVRPAPGRRSLLQVKTPTTIQCVDSEAVAPKKKTPTRRPASGAAVGEEAVRRVTASFVAYVPPEIYVLKLRGFIDFLKPDVVRVSAEETLFRFGKSGWFSTGGTQIFLRLATMPAPSDRGCRLVEATVWCARDRIVGRPLLRKAMMLVRILKAYLLVIDEEKRWSNASAAAVRATLLN